MIEGPSAVDLDVHDFSVKVASLPLFRRTEDGDLSQVLRLVVLAVTRLETQPLRSPTGIPPGTAKARSRILVHLFVPEVYEPRTFSLRVEATDREPFEAGVEILPQRKWSVFLVHHSHLDIGYTDTQSSVLQHHLQYLDSVLDLASATDDWPEDAKFRWNVEANWPLLHWMKNRPESDRIRFFDRVREGRIEICALPFSMHPKRIRSTSWRASYASRRIYRAVRRAHTDRHADRRTRGNDRPPSPLVDADVRYLSVAHNYAGRSPHLVGGQELTRPFYWRAQRQTPVGVAHGLAARQRVHGGQPGRLAEDYQATLEGLLGHIGGPCGASLPVPGAWGEHLRMDGPGSLLQRHENALSSRCAPPEGAGVFLTTLLEHCPR